MVRASLMTRRIRVRVRWAGAVIGIACVVGSTAACAGRPVSVAPQAAPAVQVSPSSAAIGPTHKWTFDEGAGTNIKDSGTAGSQPLSLGTSSAWGPGVSGTAAKFDDNGISAVAANAVIDSNTTSYTVSAWVKMARVDSASQDFVSQDGGVDSAFLLQYSGPERTFAFSFPYAKAVGITIGTPRAGAWYHLVGVRDARVGTLSLYVDGRIAATTAVPRFQPTPPGRFVVGRGISAGKASDGVDGSVDDVEVFGSALTAGQVASVYVRSSAAGK